MTGSHTPRTTDQIAGLRSEGADDPRNLTNALKGQLLSRIPKSKPLKVFGPQGDPESLDLADRIHRFLKSRGYDVKGDRALPHMFAGLAPRNINVLEGYEGRETWIAIGPRD